MGTTHEVTLREHLIDQDLWNKRTFKIDIEQVQSATNSTVPVDHESEPEQEVPNQPYIQDRPDISASIYDLSPSGNLTIIFNWPVILPEI